jgi:hypothetical protein
MRALKAADICWIDDFPSALMSITTQEKYYIRQISVQLDDQSWVHCNDASLFMNSPFGPCSIGESGDLGIYATSVELADGTIRALEGVRNEEWGDEITYIPAARVKRVGFRYSKRPSRINPSLVRKKGKIAETSVLADSKPAGSEPAPLEKQSLSQRASAELP